MRPGSCSSMPRPLRPLLAGAVYHLTAHGIRSAPIYADDADQRRFLRVFARVCSDLGWSCLAWCLMTTHYHLLVRTPQPDLSVGMKRVNESHATYFNARHGFKGHLFDGRFHSELVTRDPHLLSTVRYVALNPVDAGMCLDPARYPWSSHRALLGLEPPFAVDVEASLSHFAADGGDGRERYAEFVGCELPTGPPSTEPVCTPAPPLTELLLDGSDAAIAAAYLEGFEAEEIADELGLHPMTIRRRLRTARGQTPSEGAQRHNR